MKITKKQQQQINQISKKHQLDMVVLHGSIFGNDVDLKTLHKKDPLFTYLVMEDNILLYGDKHFYNQFKTYAYRCYIDAKPLFRLRNHLLKKGIEKLKHIYKIR